MIKLNLHDRIFCFTSKNVEGAEIPVVCGITSQTDPRNYAKLNFITLWWTLFVY